MSKKGFTLIEILIVVAIIAILSSVVLVGLGPTQRIGRDARRISDLRNVQTGAELYFNKCGYYPGTAQPGPLPCGLHQGISTWSALQSALTGSNIGVTQIPNDPASGKNYFYGTSSGGVSYVLGATLEQDSNSALQGDLDGMVFQVDCNDPVYCLTL